MSLLRQNIIKTPLCQGVLILLLLFGVGSVSSCKQATSPGWSAEERHMIDSLVHLDSSIARLQKLLKDYESHDNSYGMLACYQVLGVLYRGASDFLSAIEYHKKALAIAESESDTISMISDLNNMGTNYRRLGILDQASICHYQALSYTESKNLEENPEMARLRLVALNGIGNVQLALDNLSVADSVFRLALEGETRSGNFLGQAINYANLGSIFEQRDMIDSAWSYYRQSMACNMQAGSSLGISLCHSHFGRLFELAHQYDKAVAEYKASAVLMEGECDQWHWLGASLNLARIYIIMGKLDEAYPLLEKLDEIAQKISSYEHQSEVALLYYRWYERQGDYKKALQYYVKSKEYADTVSGDKAMIELQNARVNYERMRRDEELTSMQNQYEEERTIRQISFWGGIILLLLTISVILFLRYALRVKVRNQRVLERLEEMRTNFFTNITHEFRTPLTVILGFSKQLEEESLPSNLTPKAVGSIMYRQGTSLLSLINQLLDISKIKSAIGEPDWRHGDILPFLAVLTDGFREVASNEGIELQFATDQGSIEMDFVPDYVQKLVRNLLSNAIKYTPAGGKVTVSVSADEDFLRLSVSDTGKGIDPEELPHIFEPFYQASNSFSHVGTGIGLSLVKQVIEAVSGTIDVVSVLDFGTEFKLTVPRAYGDSDWTPFLAQDLVEMPMRAVPEHTAIKSPDPMPDEDETVGAIRLLVVEDNDDVARYIGSILQRDYQVLYATDGVEGLALAKELIPDIIITDIMMPNMTGLELCHAVRQCEIINHIPIVIITAKSSEEDRIKGIEGGADAYIYKPFNVAELRATISRILESQRILRDKVVKSIGEEETPLAEILKEADRDFLNKLVDICYKKMLGGVVELDEVAYEMCMSRSQLNRKVNAITGESVSKYLMQVRLAKAKRLLENSNKPIGDIAMECGFEDSAYFSRVFRNAYEIAPSQYRRKFLK